MRACKIQAILGIFFGLSIMATMSEAAAPRKVSPAQRSPEYQSTLMDIHNTFGFVPKFFEAFTPTALPGTWDEMKGLQLSPNTAIPGKIKELIGLAVSAQIPCEYCIFAHTEFAKLNGATEMEIKDAVEMAAATRHWSTIISGTQTNFESFKQEVVRIVNRFKMESQEHVSQASYGALESEEDVHREIIATFGFVPEFFARIPAATQIGAWRRFRDFELNPNASLGQKSMSLVGIAVGSQIPCQYCLYFDTEMAKVAGASDSEIMEAVSIAALVRGISTVLNGNQVDKQTFKKDIGRIVYHAQRAAKQKPISN